MLIRFCRVHVDNHIYFEIAFHCPLGLFLPWWFPPYCLLFNNTLNVVECQRLIIIHEMCVLALAGTFLPWSRKETLQIILVKLSLDYDSVSWNRKCKSKYRHTSNISHTSAGYENIACRRCSNYIFVLDLTHGYNKNWTKATTRRDMKHLSFGIWCALY